MARCKLCQTLSVELLEDNDVEFHKDIASLKRSADSGCDFCKLCFTRFEEDCSRTRLDACLQGKPPSEDAIDEGWVQQMWLRGEFPDMRFDERPTSSEVSSKLWVSCGKFMEENVGHGMYVHLRLFAAPGTPAAQRFWARMSTRDRDPKLAIQSAKSWLNECRSGGGPTGHKRCNADAYGKMPTRVIDIGPKSDGTNDARLLITNGLREPYVALSYCWGPGARSSVMLTRDNISRLTQSIPHNELSGAHRDAFQIAGDLGIRYVWIDALCIIQGDAKDWEYESQRMGQVYGNALLTVIAGRTGDSSLNFIENNIVQKAPPCPLRVEQFGESPSDSGLLVSLPRSGKVGPVSDRAWCFQEMHLSQRSLVYGADQIFFRCRDCTIHEDGTVANMGQMVGAAIRAGPLASPDETAAMGAKTPGSSPEWRERVLRDWYHLLMEYQLRQLSNPHDVFAALSSLAQLASHTLESRYLAGIFEVDMIRGLLWKSRHQVQSGNPGPGGPLWPPVRRPEPTFLAPGPVHRAPSWSWAAVQGPTVQISRLTPRFKADKAVARPKQTEPDRWTSDKGCNANVLHMPSCELQIIGRLKALHVMDSRKVPDYLLKQKWNTYHKGKMGKFGVLLEPLGSDTTTHADMNKEDPLSAVVAIGVFDIAEEQVPRVWCLPLVESEGLMLVEAGEGKYARAGWFTVESRDWFETGDEVDVALV